MGSRLAQTSSPPRPHPTYMNDTPTPPLPTGPTVGMAMIVKNEAPTIVACLESFWDHVDEVVIADTGSTDDTVELIRSFAREHDQGEKPDPAIPVRHEHVCIGKLRLYTYDWQDHFGKARQFVWDKLTTDWGAWCDGDDVIAGAENFRPLAASAPDIVSAYLCEYDYARDPQGNCICRLQRERLIRHGVGERWELPVHEVLQLPADRVASPTDAVTYIHNRDPEKYALDRNYLILKRDYDEAKTSGKAPSPRTVGYLATELLTLGRFSEAIPYFEEYLSVATWDEERAQAYGKLVTCILNTPEPDLDYAQRSAFSCLHAKPDWADGPLALMHVAMHKRDFKQAVEYAKRVLDTGPPQTMLITSPLQYRLDPLVAMAQACNELGDVEAAYLACVNALELVPGHPELVAHYQLFNQHLKTEKTVETVLQLRETLVRHDENWKAWKLFEAVPYFAENHPKVLAAKAEQRYNVAHMLGDDTYNDYYESNPGEAPFEVHNIDIDKADKFFGRLRFLKAGLEEQGENLKVLDAGANDGWMAKHLIDECGYEVDGIELNPDCAKRACGRGVNVVHGRIEDCATLLTPGSYDAIYWFEVIEHVVDPEDTLKRLEKMLKPGGRIYISTPNGAFENGNLPNWWVVERKGHVRVFTMDTLLELVRVRGEVDAAMVDSREGLIYAAYTPELVKIRSNVVNMRTPRRVDFFLGDGWQDFSPADIHTKGLGGSETAAVKLAEQFADKGYTVTVFAGKGSQRGVYGQVLYRPASEWDASRYCDLFVSSRIPEVFDRPINAGQKWLWLHDTDCADRFTERRCAQVDRVLVLSDWHRRHVEDMYPFIGDKLSVTCNGVENVRFKPKKRRKPWLVYTSSPDRGLDILLDVWPEVKRAVPNAELHHSYAPVYFEIAKQDPTLRAFREKIERQSEDLDGVVNEGSLNAVDLAALFSKSKVWAYPSWASLHNGPFHEVSCITALEAQAAGLTCVAPSRGALPETLRSGRMLPDSPPDEQWRAEFTQAVIAALRDEIEPSTPVDQSWEGVASQWISWLVGNEPDAAPLPAAA